MRFLVSYFVVLLTIILKILHHFNIISSRASESNNESILYDREYWRIFNCLYNQPSLVFFLADLIMQVIICPVEYTLGTFTYVFDSLFYIYIGWAVSILFLNNILISNRNDESLEKNNSGFHSYIFPWLAFMIVNLEYSKYSIVSYTNIHIYFYFFMIIYTMYPSDNVLFKTISFLLAIFVGIGGINEYTIPYYWRLVIVIGCSICVFFSIGQNYEVLPTSSRDNNTQLYEIE
ncbi:hypothetical protein WA158_004137 [Blastocystis sp. Blastoise]